MITVIVIRILIVVVIITVVIIIIKPARTLTTAFKQQSFDSLARSNAYTNTSADSELSVD